MSGADSLRLLKRHVAQLQACTACPDMIRPVVTGTPVVSPVMLIGQAPGDKEGPAGKPFAWTAGKTMFGWFAQIGISEAEFRQRVYMAAVCRCFPGKAEKGGDRVPSPFEIEQCRRHLEAEVTLIKPRLVIPVGKLAIASLGLFEGSATDKLVEVIGGTTRTTIAGVTVDVVPLPHPSGASTWHRTEPGKTLLAQALATLSKHEAWRTITAS